MTPFMAHFIAAFITVFLLVGIILFAEQLQNHDLRLIFIFICSFASGTFGGILAMKLQG